MISRSSGVARLQNARPRAEVRVMPSTRPKRPVPSRPTLGGLIAFFRQVVRDYRHVGAVMPSSAALAKAMTRSIRRHPGPKRMLEVGPGTGVMTRFMLKALRPGDELHIVEINREFARRLEERLLEPYRRENPDVVVQSYCQPIENAAIGGKFDFIVCSLPFNNFPPSVVRSIFRRLLAFLAPGGEMTYFEYAGVRVMKGSLSTPEVRHRLKRIGQVGRILLRRHNGRRELVLGNVPPAIAVSLTR